ncbi:MAG: hypothetical protein KA297_02265 [Kofleriaceae bacterium]|jgi:hypothetical protein|nr:hypothetical protein [Kofleriaceae bacterium]MBP6837832.1 hypothetical protein [Kofleriaceae bacterium]
MYRHLLVIAALAALAASACGDNAPRPDAARRDGNGATVDAAPVDCDGGCADVGGACGSSEVDLDAGALPCRAGLVCCYPCGIPDCVDRCVEPCGPPGPGCQDSGCPGPLP